MTAKVPRIFVSCPACGMDFQTTEKILAGGRGKFCSRSCSARSRFSRHGHSSHTSASGTYTSWAALRQRCLNPNHPKFPQYGGRGIKVCDRWDDFVVFLADMGERPVGTSIDRIDPNGHYEPGNCRWSTPREQQNNLRVTRFVTYGGNKTTLAELARTIGLAQNTLRYRIDSGWPEQDWALRVWGGHRHFPDRKELPQPPAS